MPWSIIEAAMQPAPNDALRRPQPSQAPQGDGMNNAKTIWIIKANSHSQTGA
jgi:hypothetical protein